MTTTTTTTSTSTLTPTQCPNCGYALVSERGAVPWCEFCEWNLDVYEPKRRRREVAWRWQDRLCFQIAFAQNRRQFRDLVGRSVDRPRVTAAGTGVRLISLLLLASVVGVAVLGGYLILDGPPLIGWFLGGLLILIAIALRPRLGKLNKSATRLDRDSAPELFRLIDEVAGAVGTKPPHAVLAVPGFTAYTLSYGLLRRRAVGLGMPMWAALTPQQRVALLGHELGHFDNADVRRGPLTSMAFSTLGTMSELTAPGPGAGGLLELFARIAMGLMNELFAALQTVVTAIAIRSTQRGEYYADAMAAYAGGTEAAVQLMDVLLLAEGISTVVRATARRTSDVTQWMEASTAVQQRLRPSVARLRQLEIRDGASLFRTHPPSPLRARMLESRPALTAAVVLSSAASSRIDTELAQCYRYMVQST